MCRLRSFLPAFVLFSLVVAGVFADDPGDISRFDNELSERDWEELRKFLNTKRTIDVAEKGYNLVISGDVRFEWRHMTERIEDIKLRSRHPQKKECLGCEVKDKNGKPRNVIHFSPEKNLVPVTIPKCKPVTKNDFDVELNLNFDYVCEGAWGVGQIQFDNTAGVNDTGLGCKRDPDGYHGSGFSNCINVRKAYMGYNVFCCGDTRFDVELGRRNLYHVFDSRVQFCSRFDGLLLKTSGFCGGMGDWVVKAAGFIIDEKVDHFGWVVEGSLLNICNSGVDAKYSLIDWHKHGRNRCGERNPVGMKFFNSQFTLGYNFFPEYLCVPAKFFAAIVWNHYDKHKYAVLELKEPSEELDEENPSSQATFCEGRFPLKKKSGEHVAWYVGFRFGEVIYKGDWALEIQYQDVDPFAIPEDDVCGIGRGNWLNERITSEGRGNTNYRGFRVDALYALTDNLNIQGIVEYSKEKNEHIGGDHSYSKFELEAIYAF